MTMRSFLGKFIPTRWVDLRAQNPTRGDDWFAVSARRGNAITISRFGERMRCRVEQVMAGDVIFNDTSGMPYIVRSTKPALR